MAVPVWSVGQVLAASDVNSWFVPLAAYKTSATVRSTLTRSTDPDLQVTVAANAVYNVRVALVYQAASGALDFTFTVPTGAGGGYSVSLFNSSGVASNWGQVWTDTGLVCQTPGRVMGVLLEGTLIISSTAGTFGLQWASNSGPASLTLGVGSCLTAWRAG